MLFLIKRDFMKLIIFSNRDLASNYFLNLILPHISTYVQGIFLSDAVGKKSIKSIPYPLQELKFFEQILINQYLFPQFDLQNRNLGTKLLTFFELSKKFNLPIMSCNDVQSPESIEYFKNIAPDLVLSVRFGKIFKSEFINIPTQGIINLHSGKLPDYRGVLATFRAMQNADNQIVTTLHFIEDGTIDTGNIIGFSPINVDYNRSLLSNILALYPASVPLVVETIEKIAMGKKNDLLVIPNIGGNYFSFPDEADFNQFVSKGLKVTDVNDINNFLQQYLI